MLWIALKVISIYFRGKRRWVPGLWYFTWFQKLLPREDLRAPTQTHVILSKNKLDLIIVKRSWLSHNAILHSWCSLILLNLDLLIATHPPVLPTSKLNTILVTNRWNRSHLSEFSPNFLHSLLTPSLSVKCTPLLPQCWATRIYEHWDDDCNIQINNWGRGKSHECFKICDEYCS